MNNIKLGISACLLGKQVRYNGGHKLDRFIIRTLGKHVCWVPVCPEVEAGLPIPRDPMQLTGDLSCPRLIVTTSGIDLTNVLNEWAEKKVKRLDKESICGFILKNRSPSCAIHDADLFTASGKKKGRTSGLFSAMLKKHEPDLPVINEEALKDPIQRENFIERVFVYKRWLDFMKKKPSVGNLISFHSDHKLQIMAHSPKHYSALGKLVAGAKGKPMKEVCQQYVTMLMEGLQVISTTKKNANVLMHIMGYFKKQLTAVQKQNLLRMIEQYRKGRVPLRVPITRIKRYLGKFDNSYLRRQAYLSPNYLS